MFRYVCAGALPFDRLWRLCYPSIDRLIELADFDFSGYKGDLDKISKEFSAILRHVHIGGVWKRTGHNRLSKATLCLAEIIKKKQFQKLRFLDVGASDGITTLEASAYLANALGVKIDAYLADQNLWIQRLKRGWIVEYKATNGEPILVRCGPVAMLLSLPKGIATPLKNWIVGQYLKLENFRSKMRTTASVALVNPRVLIEKNISLIEMDIFTFDNKLVNSMDVIRTSNVLNLNYFTPATIENAVGIIHSYLSDKGYFLASRNSDEKQGEVEHGSIWRKHKKGFVHIVDFGGGSEIKNIVNEFYNCKA